MYMRPDIPLMATPPPPAAKIAGEGRNPWKIVGAVAGVVLILGIVSLFVYFNWIKPVSNQLSNNEKAEKLIQEANAELHGQTPVYPASSFIGTWQQVSPDYHPVTPGTYYEFSSDNKSGTTVSSWSGTATRSNSRDMISGNFKVDGNRVVIKWSSGLPDRELTIRDTSGGLILEDNNGADFQRLSE
jgi:hypothetical protein